MNSSWEMAFTLANLLLKTFCVLVGEFTLAILIFIVIRVLFAVIMEAFK